MNSLHFLATVLVIGMISCQNEGQETSQAAVFREIPTPCREGGEPNLFTSETGQVYLSWVEYLNDSTDALRFSVLENGLWSEPKQIARGSDWFVNWADFPSLVAFKDGGNSLAAHWLAKSEKGTYDYAVHIAQSSDRGNNWSPSFIPHQEEIPSENGFVSMVPLSKERIFAAWLDGRNTKEAGAAQGESKSPGSEGGGAMSIRGAIFDKNGNLFEEVELDHRVCDCCQTGAALTSQGVLVAYRNRSEAEIRDISFVRQVNGKWTKPSILHSDNWEIKGCPVNGPKVAAEGNRVAIVWFTRAGKKPKVQLCFSEDAGATFGDPIRVDDGNPLGRVDVVLKKDGTAVVSWLENLEEGSEIRLAKIQASGKTGESLTVTTSSASRKSGFPVLAKWGDQLLLAWTEAGDKTTIRTMRIIY